MVLWVRQRVLWVRQRFVAKISGKVHGVPDLWTGVVIEGRVEALGGQTVYVSVYEHEIVSVKEG